MSEENTQPAADAATEGQAPNLTVNDLAAVANVIDLAVQRGAFKAAEAKQVGEVFDKVAGFFKHVGEQQKASEEAAPAESAPAEEAPAA